MYKIFGENEFLPESAFIQNMVKIFCEENQQEEKLCTSLIGLIGGTDESQMNSSRIPVFLADEPAGTSTKNFIHWLQLVRSGKMQKYDYEDVIQNMKHYGQSTPPQYDIGKINTDVHLFWSPTDWLADEKDIEGFLLKNINKKSLKENNKLVDFNHVDFTWGNRARNEVYKPIVTEIQKDIAAHGDP